MPSPTLLVCRQCHDKKWKFVKTASKTTGLSNAVSIMREVEHNNHYFQCNCYAPKDLSSLPADVRKLLDVRLQHKQKGWWQYAYGLQDLSRASLWLLGSKGCGTGFHVDWAEANNIAWAIGEEKVMTFLACPPVAMYTLHDFQQNMDSQACNLSCNRQLAMFDTTKLFATSVAFA